MRSQKLQVARRTKHLTQWAAQFAVASELSKLHYEVSFTLGNCPVADLMVVTPSGREMFLVEVKGLARPNPWVIRRKPANAKLFYILAHVPYGARNEFFVMNQKQADRLVTAELKRLKRSEDYRVKGFIWSLAKPYKERWDILPEGPQHYRQPPSDD